MRAKALLIVALSVVASCGDTEPAPTDAPAAATTTTTTTQPSATTAPIVATTAPPTTVTAVTPTGAPPPAPTTTLPTTTTGAPTTTTQAPMIYVVDGPGLYPPDPLPGSAGASGSGCSPGTGDLPDGVWFGYVRAVGPLSVEFDLGCFFFGDIAWEVAAAAGEEAPNDFYIMNSNPALRIVPVAPGTPAWTLGADSSAGLQEIAYEEWPPDGFTYTPCPGEFCSVWLYVNGGEATAVVEQYLP